VAITGRLFLLLFHFLQPAQAICSPVEYKMQLAAGLSASNLASALIDIYEVP
jgi:hypothetical protein